MVCSDWSCAGGKYGDGNGKGGGSDDGGNDGSGGGAFGGGGGAFGGGGGAFGGGGGAFGGGGVSGVGKNGLGDAGIGERGSIGGGGGGPFHCVPNGSCDRDGLVVIASDVAIWCSSPPTSLSRVLTSPSAAVVRAPVVDSALVTVSAPCVS